MEKKKPDPKISKQNFSRIMVELGEIFRNKPSELVVNSYYKALNNISFERLREGVDIIIRDKKDGFFPLPAQIREVCPEEIEQVALDYIPTKEDQKEYRKFLGGIKEVLRQGGKL
ncbi:MAG: hypothetical protein PHX21_12635 [bacterium]|nr:hypothetical protein [bacterium]